MSKNANEPIIRTVKTDKIIPGRPIRYNFKEKQTILEAFKLYVETEEFPSVPAFCAQQKLSKRRLYEWAAGENENADTKNKYPLKEYFHELIEQLNAKAEAFVEKNVMLGNINPSFAIFKLKQRGFGWTDKQDVNVTGDMKISIGLPPDFGQD